MAKDKMFYAYLGGGVLLWLYLILRACWVPPVHDEAATFFHYINHREFFPGHALYDANNHILNSFLGGYFVKLFGVNTFSIRAANLMFFPVYVYFLYKFSQQLKQPGMKWLLLITGLCIHGFVEYFGYSRGYGMSMGILMGALYYSYKFLLQKNIRLLIAAIAFYWLATLSNLTLQNTALMFLGIAGLYIFIIPFSNKQRMVGLFILLVGAAGLLPFVKLSLDMKRDGLLYYAQGEDFWTAVITSFTQQFFDSKNIPLKLFWFLWTGIFLCYTLAYVLRLRLHGQNHLERLLFPLLFFGNLFSIIAMHLLLGVNYPSDRTGMHLLLYLFLGGIFLADLNGGWKRFVVVIPTLFFVIQFAVGANFSYSTYWKGEHIPQRFYDRIYSESIAAGNANPTIGGYRIRNLVWAWYNFKNNGELQNMQYFNYYNGFEDYQLFSTPDYDKALYDSLDFDALSGITLARRKHFLHTELYLDSTGYKTPENFTGEYYNLYETITPDSFINKAWLVEADLKIYSLLTPPKVRFVTAFFNDKNEQTDYQISPLDWLKKEYRPEDRSVTVKLWWYNVPADTKRIVVYLWNIDSDAYTLQDASFRIFKVNDMLPHPDTAPSLVH